MLIFRDALNDTGDPYWPLRVAFLSSKRSPGLDYLIDQDPNRGVLYDIVGCLCSQPSCIERQRLHRAHIPHILHDLRAFYAERDAPISDLELRKDFDRAAVSNLSYFRPDLIVLCGYQYLVTEPLLSAFPNRVINVHHSDMCDLDGDGMPRYRGLHAVRDAIMNGERETRSTVHLVTPQLDAGPPLVRSRAFPVQRELVESARRRRSIHILKAYAYAHREWMLEESWGPLLALTIALFARGEVEGDDRAATVAGRPGPLDLPSDPTEPRLSGGVHKVAGG